MGEVIDSFVQRRADSMTDTLLGDLTVDIRSGTNILTEEQIKWVNEETMRRSAREIIDLTLFDPLNAS